MWVGLCISCSQRFEQRLWPARWQLNCHDRRRLLARFRTAPSHQLWRTQGGKQRSHGFEHAGQTVKAASSALTMSRVLRFRARQVTTGKDTARTLGKLSSGVWQNNTEIAARGGACLPRLGPPAGQREPAHPGQPVSRHRPTDTQRWVTFEPSSASWSGQPRRQGAPPLE